LVKIGQKLPIGNGGVEYVVDQTFKYLSDIGFLNIAYILIVRKILIKGKRLVFETHGLVKCVYIGHLYRNGKPG